MSIEEYDSMCSTGMVHMSPKGNTTYVSNPADKNAFSAAKPGTIYVEFDVDASAVYKAGNSNWGQIPGPGSNVDRYGIKKGNPPILEMPNAYNIEVVESN